MVKKHFKISGVGCALVDYLFTPINFSGETFSRYISVRPGDGGLFPGKLVFRDEFEAFSGRDYMEVRELLTAGNSPVTLNIGGTIHCFADSCRSDAGRYCGGSLLLR